MTNDAKVSKLMAIFNSLNEEEMEMVIQFTKSLQLEYGVNYATERKRTENTYDETI